MKTTEADALARKGLSPRGGGEKRMAAAGSAAPVQQLAQTLHFELLLGAAFTAASESAVALSGIPALEAASASGWS
ncbi:MAG: hypothetical protein ACOZD0_05720 [Pseudomonadota bacterium]